MSIITNVRTIRLEQFPNSIWVEIETDENLTGLGEAWRGTAAIETIIHHDICPWLIGQDSRNIELISRTLLIPNEIPIGIVAAVIGAPYFLYLLIMQD